MHLEERINDAEAAGGIVLVDPFAGDGNSTQSFAADWILCLPNGLSAAADAFNWRMYNARKFSFSTVDTTVVHSRHSTWEYSRTVGSSLS